MTVMEVLTPTTVTAAAPAQSVSMAGHYKSSLWASAHRVFFRWDMGVLAVEACRVDTRLLG